MNWAHYLLQVNIYLALFYGFYWLLLEKETFFKLNRIYLTGTALLSLGIPLLHNEWVKDLFITKSVAANISVLNEYFVNTNVMPLADETLKISWGQIAAAIYVTGILILLIRLIWQLLKINTVFRKQEEGKAFSFFGKIYIDPTLPQQAIISQHENIHVRQLHSADILFFEFLNIINWFNPVIYLYKTAIRHIHEFIADEEAAQVAGNKGDYAMLLFSQAFNIDPDHLTSNFHNRSLLKLRIKMLHQNKSRKTAVLKYGLSVPLFGVMTILSSATISKNEIIQDIAIQIPLDDPAEAIKQVSDAIEISSSNHSKITATNRPPAVENLGAIKKRLINTLRSTPRTPEGRQPNYAVINFEVDANGKLERINQVYSDGSSSFKKEVRRAFSSLRSFNNTAEGKHTLYVHFKPNETLSSSPQVAFRTTASPTEADKTTPMDTRDRVHSVNITSPAKGQEDNNSIYNFASIDAYPEYVGGNREFSKYLERTLRYPAVARENNVQGKVFIQFVVEKDGSITDIKVARGIGSGCDEEAVRAIQKSPKWLPGKQEGKTVRVMYTIPITFALMKAQDSPITTIKINNVSAMETQSATGTIAAVGNRNPGMTIKTAGEIISRIATKDPLVVINGSIVPGNGINILKNLNMKNVENVSILKGISATSIYGDAGRDGAVIVTGRRGQPQPKE